MITKENLFRVGLISILILAGILCIYSIWNYKGYNSFTAGRIGYQNPSADHQNRPGFTANNPAPGGQGQIRSNEKAGQHMPPQNRGGEKGRTGSSNNTGYSLKVIVYAAIFFILSVLAYFLHKNKKIKINPRQEKILILTLLGIGLFLRIAAATLISGHADINIFKNWATTAANNLFGVYSSSGNVDYPPLYMYILYVIGKISSIPAISSYYTLLLKLPSIIADIATSYIIYRLARKYLSLELSILLSAFYIFNPAIFINSTLWGQVDSFFTLIVVSSMFMLAEKRIVFASALFTAAVLMKPQGIIFLPVLFFELVRQKNWQAFVKAIISGLAIATIIVLPFTLHQSALWIFQLYAHTVGEYPYASVNAFNFFSLIGANYKSDASAFLLLSYHSWGMIFIVLVTAFSWLIYIKGNSLRFIPAAALMQIAGVFTLATGMHERYLFPAVALAVLSCIYLKDKRLLLLAGGFSLTSYINMHAILFGQMMNSVSYSPVLIITACLNILLLGYLGKVLYDLTILKVKAPGEIS